MPFKTNCQKVDGASFEQKATKKTKDEKEEFSAALSETVLLRSLRCLLLKKRRVRGEC